MARKTVISFIIALVIFGCTTLPETIKDEVEIRQDHKALVEEKKAERPLMDLLLPAATQSKMDADYNAFYFSVWHNPEPVHARPERVEQIFKRFSLNPGYGENKRKHSLSWIRALQKNAALDNYPKAMERAITIRQTNLRMLPTNRPHFYKPGGDIEGWPFDNLQISSVPTNTPVLICHLSEDKSWALVETSFAFGWVPVEDIARADENFRRTWECGRYGVVIKDKTTILDEGGKFSIRTSVGQIFPLVGETEGMMEILIAAADENGNAVIKRTRVSPRVVAAKPLPFTYSNAVNIANEFIDEPYGWGGLYGNRDCSAMTRDFFAPFGIWLPRHSADQAKTVGSFIDLQNLDPQEKEKIIVEKGVPYLSLLWRKGHVMLYIGAPNGRPLIFHNVWGLKIRDCRGREGRKIIGKAVITSLYPGAELPQLDRNDGLLINKIAALTILAPLEQDQAKQKAASVVSSKNKEAGSI
ncbi:MAG TPA: SH3 domain-containing protein [Smithella sp.]|nr:SH3 domain-containing protein [Smithella sp.]